MYVWMNVWNVYGIAVVWTRKCEAQFSDCILEPSVHAKLIFFLIWNYYSCLLLDINDITPINGWCIYRTYCIATEPIEITGSAKLAKVHVWNRNVVGVITLSFNCILHRTNNLSFVIMVFPIIYCIVGY